MFTSHIRYGMFIKVCPYRTKPERDSDRGTRRSGMLRVRSNMINGGI